MNKKEKFALWLCPDTKEKVDYYYQKDNCSSRSEFIEKAVNFYTGYLETKQADRYLPQVLQQVLEGNFAVMKSKLGRMLFRQAVDLNVIYHILAYDTDIDLEQLERLRYRSVRDVQETNGEVSFKDALKFQKTV